jgi:hypothetical protein
MDTLVRMLYIILFLFRSSGSPSEIPSLSDEGSEGFNNACTLLEAKLGRRVGGAVCPPSREGGNLAPPKLQLTPSLLFILSASGGVIWEANSDGLGW